jgi:hypothetical protein
MAEAVNGNIKALLRRIGFHPNAAGLRVPD